MDRLSTKRRGRQAVLSRHLLDLIGDFLPKPDRDCGRVPFFLHSDLQNKKGSPSGFPLKDCLGWRICNYPLWRL
jgi:hypothetical protein